MKAERASGRGGRSGFTLIELVVIICILGILAVVGIPKYVSMIGAAESASVEHDIGTLASALNIYTARQLTSNLPITAHNPFDDLVAPPANYAGAFGDVDLTNCRPGQWAYQSGSGANGNWPVLVYRPRSTLAAAFGWSSTQWIVYEVKTVAGDGGAVVGLTLSEYPPPHQW